MDGPQVIIKLILRCSWGSSCRNMFCSSSIRVYPPLSLSPLPSCTRWNNRIYLYAPSEGVAHVRLLKRFHPEYILHPPSLHSRFLFVLFSSRRHVASLAVSFSKLTRGGVFNLIRECFRNRAERVVKFSSLVTFLFFFQREREREGRKVWRIVAARFLTSPSGIAFCTRWKGHVFPTKFPKDALEYKSFIRQEIQISNRNRLYLRN